MKSKPLTIAARAFVWTVRLLMGVAFGSVTYVFAFLLWTQARDYIVVMGYIIGAVLLVLVLGYLYDKAEKYIARPRLTRSRVTFLKGEQPMEYVTPYGRRMVLPQGAGCYEVEVDDDPALGAMETVHRMIPGVVVISCEPALGPELRTYHAHPTDCPGRSS